METYYVVKKGFKTGIFKTWIECKNAVEGYSNPFFKKFSILCIEYYNIFIRFNFYTLAKQSVFEN